MDGFSFLVSKMKISHIIYVWGFILCCVSFSCGKGERSVSIHRADSLNRCAYEVRYKSLDECERLSGEALTAGVDDVSEKAKALNNLGFCAFIRMDFDRSDSLLNEVFRVTSNELECLIADVGLMKICQRTAMNKEFYDYRNSALRRIKHINDDTYALSNPAFLKRFHYACTEFSITSAIYYYYLQQEKQSLEAIDEINVEEELKGDTAQLLYYYYMKGSGGMYVADTPEGVVVGEFDYLLDCLTISHEQGYIYFEANALQALAELFKIEKNYQLLLERRPGMMRVVNQKDLPWDELVLSFSKKAIELFKKYGDWYQISGSYRTLASCLNELERYEEALESLSEALSYVNLHHEKYYHCEDSVDRLKTYVPMATHSIELEWVNNEGIRTVPEWIARFREQLSVTYAALGMKPESDYNRNIYLDILDYTRQDKELESRYMALEEESAVLSMMLVFVILGLVLAIISLGVWNKFWKEKNTQYVHQLKETLDICRLVIASTPLDAEDMDDIVQSMMGNVKDRILSLVEATDMQIIVSAENNQNCNQSEYCTEVLLETDHKTPLGKWKIYSKQNLKKDDKALLKVIAPYISWTLENGLSLISLDDERKRLEKEQYVYERHLIENKRRNVVKKACLFIVTGITPYIDRVINEIHKLISFNYLENEGIKESKYRYISELTSRINEYNDILALWIKMKQGSLSLNIENFHLGALFDVVQRSRRTFEAKELTFEVKQTDAFVKADKALTLFMINTLAENARKYTPKGGKVEVYAQETDAYVEISVRDSGIGLSAEDVSRILDEKVYDSAKIGCQTGTESIEWKNKGHGFGLMNCKGIIEKYRKTNELFRVCCFQIESEPQKGSRFYFRLPKGIRRTLTSCVGIVGLFFASCTSSPTEPMLTESEMQEVDATMVDTLLVRANDMANQVYHANLEGRYQAALNYADSALVFLNAHYLKYATHELPLLKLEESGNAAELEWFANDFYTDYYTLLDVRNEAAVAHLALGNLEAYRFNNNAYTSLYKQISVDKSLESFCVQMEKSANGKMVAIILCIVILVVLLLGYYGLYFRHLLAYRYSIEQVLEINRRAFSLPLSPIKEADDLGRTLVEGLYKDIHEWMSIEGIGISVSNEEQRPLTMSFSTPDIDNDETRKAMSTCYLTQKIVRGKDQGMLCLPLCIDVGEERCCLGTLALVGIQHFYREDDELMLELVASYIAVIVYNAIRLVAQKYHDIEVAQDEARRVQREENQLHVQNMVLDNCLSTIKHETIYYPNKIKQIVEKLNQGQFEGDERRQVETIAELVAYYKDIFTILSSCAARQLEEITFRRGVVLAKEVADYATRYMKRVARKENLSIDWEVEVSDLRMTGDVIQLNYLMENLIDEALSYPVSGRLQLEIYQEGGFIRFDFIDHRRSMAQEELNQLFYPHLSKITRKNEEVLAGTEYLICKQIIREHDEFAGRRGCRINAQKIENGGFMVWFTIPSR